MLELGEPLEIKLLGLNPSPGDELGFVRIEPDVIVGPKHLAEEIRLFLADKSPKGFRVLREKVPVAALLPQHTVMMWLQPKFLGQFAFERLRRRLPAVDAPLWELPRILEVAPFAHEQPAIPIHQQRRNIRPIPFLHRRLCSCAYEPHNRNSNSTSRATRSQGGGLNAEIFSLQFVLRSIFDSLRHHWHWVLALPVVALGGWMLSQGVTAEGQVKVRTEKFRRALSDKNSNRAWTMVSASYRDQWGLDRDGLRLAINDVTTQFLALDVQWSEPEMERKDREVLVKARPHLAGRSVTPVGEMILQRAAKIHEPFVFRWEKEGWWPWSWHLRSIQCPALEIPDGYRPGMLSGRSFSLDQAF